MKIYILNRKIDVSGVSGTGLVGEAVRFDDGTTIVKFTVDDDSAGDAIVYHSFEKAVRVHGHDGDTDFVLVGDTDYSGVKRIMVGVSE